MMPGTCLAREAAAPLRFVWNQVLPRVIPLLRRMLSANIHTPAESGAAVAQLVLNPALEGTSGKYFEGRGKSAPHQNPTIRDIPSSCGEMGLALTGLLDALA